MAETEIEIAATPKEVFSTLVDCCTYESWLVGCKEIRDVESAWPEPGSRFFHRVGMGPLTIADSTKVVSIDENRELVLEARARPAGIVHVRFVVERRGEGSVLRIHELPKRGLVAAAWNPAFQVMIHMRNKESLRRLKNFIEDGDQEPASN